MTLTRTKVVPEMLLGPHTELARQAVARLNYHALSQSIQAKAAQRTLFTTLAEHGIEWFDPKDIARYRLKKIDDAPFKVAAWTAGVLGVALFLWATTYDGVPAAWRVGLALCCGIVAIVATVLQQKRTSLVWTRESLDYNYKKPIPTFVLETALKIREANSNFHFVVESLEARRVVYDPFLVVLYEGAEAYVEVWGEPSFNAERS